MTKLMEWLLLAVLIFSVWIALITESNSSFIKEWKQFIIVFPLFALFVFIQYAAIIILCRVLTFNNCEHAAIELQEQIEEAKEDLQNKGVVLKCK